jgi:hypothetical protein
MSSGFEIVTTASRGFVPSRENVMPSWFVGPTRGPWKIKNSRIDDPAFYVDIVAPRPTKATKAAGTCPTVATVWRRPEGPSGRTHEQQNNADLIAAAPALNAYKQYVSNFLNGSEETLMHFNEFKQSEKFERYLLHGIHGCK